MKDYSIEEISRIVRPELGETVPLVLFRVLRIIGMKSILGETSGAALYMMGKRVGSMFPVRDMDEFHGTLRELKVGIAESIVTDREHITVKLYECITCAGFPNTGEMFCDMESGIIAGLIESIHGKKARSTQTKSWSAGFNHCEFEVFLY